MSESNLKLIKEMIARSLSEGPGDGKVDASDVEALKGIASDIGSTPAKGALPTLQSTFDAIDRETRLGQLGQSGRDEIIQLMTARRRWASGGERPGGGSDIDAIIEWYGSPSFEALYDWFMGSGDMPYAVAKGRADIGPEEWILDQLISIEDGTA